MKLVFEYDLSSTIIFEIICLLERAREINKTNVEAGCWCTTCTNYFGESFSFVCFFNININVFNQNCREKKYFSYVRVTLFNSICVNLQFVQT